jgi:CRP-like cAMP-binding protein/CheY-like chemotaxis protein
LIEDNVEMRENTAELLDLAGYEVHTAPNGKAGVDLAEKILPDLIICDIMMPVLDGYGVLHLLSKKDETASIPFIFFTAKAERGDLRKGMEMGADDYITKPFDDMELLNAVESRLRKKDVLKKEFAKTVSGLQEFMTAVHGSDALQHLSEQHDAKTYRKREIIYSEGQYPRGIYFVSKGKLKTYKTNDTGKELITGLFKEGDFFGYLALLEETTFTDSAEALEDVEVYLLPKDDFYSLLYKSADVSKKFIKMLSDNLAAKEEQLLKLAYNSVRKRVAEALVTLEQRYRNESSQPFSMNISREDIANIAGTSPETAIRMLSDFKDENLIHIKGSMITILDYNKLNLLKN